MTNMTDTSKHVAAIDSSKSTSSNTAPVGAAKASPTPVGKPDTPKDAADAAARGHTPAEHAKHGHEA